MTQNADAKLEPLDFASLKNRAYLIEGDFRHLNMNTILADYDIRGISWYGSLISNVDFTKFDISGSSFIGAQLMNCELDFAKSTNVYFDRATINGVSVEAAKEQHENKMKDPLEEEMFAHKRTIGSISTTFEKLLENIKQREAQDVHLDGPDAIER